MIIQAILIGGLLLCLLYALSHRQQSHTLSRISSVVALTGIYLVVFPERTNQLAHFVGVGRGADLIFYCWLIISISVSLNLRLQIFELQGHITDLARQMALDSAAGQFDSDGRLT